MKKSSLIYPVVILYSLFIVLVPILWERSNTYKKLILVVGDEKYNLPALIYNATLYVVIGTIVALSIWLILNFVLKKFFSNKISSINMLSVIIAVVLFILVLEMTYITIKLNPLLKQALINVFY